MALTKVKNDMINNSVVNVRDFGAVGDNSTDDTAAVQAALNYAFQNDKILEISGACRIFDTLTLPQTGVNRTNPVLRIKAGGGHNNYETDELDGSLVADDSIAASGNDLIMLDLRYQETTPKRFTVIIDGVNIMGRNTVYGCGIYTSSAWLTMRDVGIKGWSTGLVINESYKINIDSCSITGCDTAINFSGYCSVVNITGSQLRNNTTLFDVKASTRRNVGEFASANSGISEGNISGNNVESCDNIFYLHENDAGIIGLDYHGNYDENNDYMIRHESNTGTYVKVSSFYSKYSVKYQLDETYDLTLSGTPNIESTTDATSAPIYKTGQNYLNILPNYQLNLSFPRETLNIDCDFAMQSLVSDPVQLPPDTFNSNLSGVNLSWEDGSANQYREGKRTLRLGNTSGALREIRWDFDIKDVATYSGIGSYAYRIRIQYTLKSSGQNPNLRYRLPDAASDVTINQAASTDWKTYVSTVDVPAGTNGNMNIKLNIPAGSTFLLDSFLISYVDNPVINRPEFGVINLAIPTSTVVDIEMKTYEEDADWSAGFLGSADVVYFTRGASDDIVSVQHGGASTLYPYLMFRPRKTPV